MSEFHIQVVSERPIDWGESPYWDETRQKLYYVDCFAKSIYQIDPENGKCDSINIVSESSKSIPMTTIAIPAYNDDNNTFIVTLGNSIAKYSENTGQLLKLAEIENGQYFNDGKCDKTGRLWIGTFKGEPGNAVSMQKGCGSIYQFGNSGSLVQQSSGMSICNGLTWSIDYTKMFVVDTMERTIYSFNFDSDSATICNKKVFFTSNSNFSFKGTEIPYGITNDIRGNLWLVVYYGGKLLNIDCNTGQVINRIDLKANMVTSACFGGPELNELFVTSSNRGLSSEQISTQQAGHTFKVTCYRDNSFKGFASNPYIQK